LPLPKACHHRGRQILRVKLKTSGHLSTNSLARSTQHLVKLSARPFCSIYSPDLRVWLISPAFGNVGCGGWAGYLLPLYKGIHYFLRRLWRRLSSEGTRPRTRGYNPSRFVYSREAPIKFFERPKGFTGCPRVVLELWAAHQNLRPAYGEATRPPTASASSSQ
jgi:hypothetical protein